GRIPVSTSEALSATINKILGYETAPAGAWQSRAVLIDGDPAWDARVNSAAAWLTDREVSGVPADWEGRRVSFNRETPIGGAHESLVWEEYQRGALYISYVGHGSVTWTDGVTPGDVVHLQPREGAP